MTLALTRALAAPDTRYTLTDGSLWSHAATLGSFVYSGPDDRFELTSDMMASFVRNFTRGSPAKVPVDYEHASTSNDPVAKALRYKGEAPRAGTVLELRAVATPDDLPLTALSQLLGAGMTAEQGAGLWMRWMPTPRALSQVQSGEYTELSIAFNDEHMDSKSGDAQGPTLTAVALCQRPFLQDMPSIAATDAESQHTHRRADDPPPADDARDDASTTAVATPARHYQRGTMSDVTNSLSAVLGKPVSEQEVPTRVLELSDEITATRRAVDGYRELSSLIPGATPAEKAKHYRELAAENVQFKQEAAEQRQRALGAIADSILDKHTDRIVPAKRDTWRARLLTELSAGVEAGKTDAESYIADLTPHGLTEQQSAGDSAEPAPKEAKIALRAAELREKGLSALPADATVDQRNAVRIRAITDARRELGAAD